MNPPTDSSPLEPGSFDVLLIEDHAETAQGLTAVAQAAFPERRIFWVNSHAAALDAFPAISGASLVLTDLVLPDGTGIDLIQRLRASGSDILCVVTTIYDDDEYLFPALAAGADGYLLKQDAPETPIQHLKALDQGIPALSPRVARRMLTYFQKEHARMQTIAPLSGPEQALTPRETQVLSLIGRGLQRGEVATQLGISENTVAKFIKDIYRKLNISSRAEAAIEAAKRRLL